MKNFSHLRYGLTAFLLLSSIALADDAPASSESACLSSRVASVVSRPTVANATDPTQCGVVEVEYGYDHQWVGAGAQHNDLTGGLRFGITPNLDLHYSSASYLNVSSPGASQTGFGDTYIGLKYRFKIQTKKRPSFGAFYSIKAPTASYLKGLGSGQIDNAFSFIASKDITRWHIDFNATELLIGRPAISGDDHNTGLAMANWITVTKRFTFIVEPYGYTTLNATTPGFASAMAGFSYQINPRLYLDSGLDAGVSHFAPNKRVYVGATYAIANYYRWFSKPE